MNDLARDVPMYFLEIQRSLVSIIWLVEVILQNQDDFISAQGRI